MSDYVAVLFANDAFYLAFTGRDLAAMDDIWARKTPVTCIHPGWALTTGREDVLASWEAILTNPHAPEIRCRDATATVLGGHAYVLCYEELDSGFLIATNIFVREDGAWKIVHHQAGEAPPPDTAADDDAPPETMQ